MRVRGWAVLLSLSLALACPAPEARAPLLRVQSGSTRVVAALSPFSLLVQGPEGTVGRSAQGEGGCAPLMVALRPADDEGRYHKPFDPEPTLAWMRTGNARVFREEPLTLEVELLSPEGEVRGSAKVVIAPDREGFVRADVELPFDDREVALLGACFGLDEQEHVVGGGERFDGVDLRGRVIPLSFEAPGPFASGTNESHAPVPFFATTRGLAVLVETERPGAFDVGATDAGALAARFSGATLPLRLRAGSLVENAAAHARYMGLSPMPPRWVLAPQQWRNEHDVTVGQGGEVISNGRDRFLDDARTLRALGIPTTTMWIDAPWSTGHNTFTFNEVQFPDPASMIAEAERLGYRVIVWATEHLNRSDDSDQMFGMPPYGSLAVYERFRDAGHLVKNGTGDGPFHFRWARGEGGFVDFSSPEACAAYQGLMRPLLDLGVRGFKLDYGETMRPSLLGILPNDLVTFADGSTVEVMHTRYARLYHECFLGALLEVWPDDHFVITRTGGIYDQRNGVAIWPGDLDNDFSRAGEIGEDGALKVGGLPAAISAALSLSLSGYPLYGSDIGGYRGGPPTTEVLLRWAQFGAVSTIMQLGGGGTGDATHNPWDERYDEIAVDVYRRYARLHMDLLPTLERLLWRATTLGTPPLLPLGALFPSDEEAWADPEALALGEDLIAFPVVKEGATTRQVWIPEGTWIDWWTGERLQGPKTHLVPAPLDVMPLYQRAGAITFLGDPRLQTAVSAEAPEVADVDVFGDTLVLRTAPGPMSEKDLPDGTRASQRTEGSRVEVRVESPKERLLVFELWLSEEIGPGPGAEVRLDGRLPSEVTTEEALLACDDLCLLRTEAHLRVATSARDATLLVQGP